MSLVELFWKTIAPHDCLGCGAEGSLLCTGCATQLPAIASRCYRCARATEGFRACAVHQASSDLVQVWAATSYNGLAKELVHKLKFERAREAALVAARLIAFRLPPDQTWLITHIPTATSRIRVRGYDQAQLIAREVARLTGQPYAALLARMNQDRQVGTGRAQRRLQQRGAFRFKSWPPAPKQPVLLIDDILTTGGTIEAAAAVLRANGTQHISAAVLAAA